MAVGLRITTLVENTTATNVTSAANSTGLFTEHGLAFWIEYAGKHLLFDTGAGRGLIPNARKLGVDLRISDAVVISHGHYDHTGSLSEVLRIAPQVRVYMHPGATELCFSFRGGTSHYIGISDAVRNILPQHKVVWTATPTTIIPGITVTGFVPRNNQLEDSGGAFYQDTECTEPDSIIADQSLFIDTPDGLVVVSGCAHAGIINILDYINQLNPNKKIYSLLGGLHLRNASTERIEATLDTFRKYDIAHIGPCHCTGAEAVSKIKDAFPQQFFRCCTGSVFTV